MKDKIIFSYSSAIFVAEFSTAKELARITKEVGLDTNLKGEGEDSRPKKGLRAISL